jgi:hypothetical protein
MALEAATYINTLDPSNPAPTDQLRQADDHIRLIKAALKQTFPNITGPVTLTQDALNVPFVTPAGVISLWYGSEGSIPTGYALCNGSVQARADGSGSITTPDLRGRVAQGADGIFSQGATFGEAASTITSSGSGGHTHTVDGGSHTHPIVVVGTGLTVAQIPAHDHGNSVVHDTANIFMRAVKAIAPHVGRADWTSGSGAFEGITESVGSGATHTHDATAGSSTHTHAVSEASPHTHTTVVAKYQPTMALHYIMKL